MAATLCACAGNSGEFASFQAGDARLAVALPSVCEAFLQPVKQPPVTKKTDARIAYVRAADGLDEADLRLILGADCLADQRKAYSKGPSK